MSDEEVLHGGVANAGAVVRVGDHVLRPSNPHSTSIHRYLDALRRTGFDGASVPVGIDTDGRERLGFIPGEVAFVEMWESMGGQERFDRRRRWWDTHRDEFAAALA